MTAWVLANGAGMTLQSITTLDRFKRALPCAAWCILVFVLMQAVLLFCAPAQAGEASRRKMIVLLADHTSLSDWSTPDLPVLQLAMKRGALGLMVVRMSVAPREDSDGGVGKIPDTLYMTDVKRRAGAHLSISAGVPAVQNEKARLSFHVYESFSGRSVRRLFKDLTGRHAPRKGIVNLGLAGHRQRDESTWEARPGILGELLKRNGVRTAVVGNSDCRSRMARFGAVLAADRDGVVLFGAVGGDLRHGVPGKRNCCRANTDRLIEEFRIVYEKADFIVVEFCDTACIAQKHIGDELNANLFQPYMKAPMQEFDQLLASILDIADLETTQVVILSPTPSVAAYANKRALTPVLFLGRDVPAGPALVTSQSTRRSGLVVNLDIAPHITHYFGIEPAREFIGSQVRFVPHVQPVALLRDFEDRDAFVESHGYLLRRSVMLHTFVILLCFVVLLRVKPVSKTWLHGLKVLILFTMSVFLAFLLVAALGQVRTEIGFYSALVLLCAAIVGLVLRSGDAVRSLSALCAVYMLVLVLDQVAGAPLIKHSVMGYFAQRGARFYGIGNEYAGVLLSAPVFLYGILLDRHEQNSKIVRKLFPAIFAFIVFVCASPFWGANFGATVSCAATFIIMAALVQGWRMRWVHLPLAAGIVVLALGAMVLMDTLLPLSDSHVGGLVQRVMHGGGAEEIFKIAWRKLAVNLRLMRVPAWSSLFVLNIGLAALLLFRAPERIARVFVKFPNVRRALAASAAGAVFALAVNDSGLITGAIALCLPLLAVFLLALEHGGSPRHQHSGMN